ncbi:uncharacterized protein BDZ83DRAFT_389494 [Colletotrichum acutatum]|uniref:Uncharacterized protein n=1 Tax=Glomerella acutata TaxID=27357 RepID=A0AAD8XD78_GLOAC|nr:uncharacterized protein BDZ83DRAFT_389494 [Colletotrichum acutatum]KAK1723419.1 hypothetical protein BDZ83DRAFT_389494 [Colletotrichum acutatum]
MQPKSEGLPPCCKVAPEALYWNRFSLLFSTNLNHGLISRLTAAPKHRRGRPFRGKDLPPPLAFTNEGSRKRQGQRHYQDAVTPSGVPIPFVGGIPAVRRNSPRFKHVGPRRRSDGAPCSPFRRPNVEHCSVRGPSGHVRLWMASVLRWWCSPGPSDLSGFEEPHNRRSLARRCEETSFRMKHTLFDGIAVADILYYSPSLLPNKLDELLKSPICRRTRWEPQVVAKNGSTAADKCRGAASSLAAGVITRTIPNSSRITSESSGEVHLEAIIGYRAAHHQLPLVTGLRLSPESYQDGFHE